MLAPALVVLSAGVAVAQTPVDPSVTPELNTGGWVHGMAILLGILGLVVILLLVAGYVRFAPRFSTDESTSEGRPRRPRAARPGAPTSHGGHQGGRARRRRAAAVAATGRRRRRAGRRTRRRRARARAAPAPPPHPRRRRLLPPRPNRLRSPRRPPQRPPPAAPAAPAPAAAPHAEVSLDQEVFDATLKELLDKGTDKRVAEGQARRAAMIAARKKAAGEA